MSDTSSPAAGRLAVAKEVEVRGRPASAFRRFTEEIHTWWPLATHSVGAGEAETVILEGREGGRVFERLRDGTEHDWGRVVEWDPPRRFAMTWHPGREPDTATRVEIEFRASAEGTSLRLRHTGWEKLGDEAEGLARRYGAGWEGVLDRFARTA